MDPQKLSQLDPKLRDAYQRVMGTPIPQPQTQPIQAQTPTPPAIEEPPAIPTTPVQPPTSEPQPISTPEPTFPQQPAVQASNFVQMNSEVAAAPSSQNFAAPMPQAQTVTIKKKNGMMTPILFGIAALFFIVIYTLFWAKIFNFKVPFLP